MMNTGICWYNWKSVVGSTLSLDSYITYTKRACYFSRGIALSIQLYDVWFRPKILVKHMGLHIEWRSISTSVYLYVIGGITANINTQKPLRDTSKKADWFGQSLKDLPAIMIPHLWSLIIVYLSLKTIWFVSFIRNTIYWIADIGA